MSGVEFLHTVPSSDTTFCQISRDPVSNLEHQQLRLKMQKEKHTAVNTPHWQTHGQHLLSNSQGSDTLFKHVSESRQSCTSQAPESLSVLELEGYALCMCLGDKVFISGISLRPEINPCVDFQRCIYSKPDLAWNTELLKLEMCWSETECWKMPLIKGSNVQAPQVTSAINFKWNPKEVFLWRASPAKLWG